MIELNVINLTRDPVMVNLDIKHPGASCVRVEPSGTVAKVRTKERAYAKINGIELIEHEFDGVDGIEDLKDDCIYVVPYDVKEHVKDHKNCIMPGECIITRDGKIIAMVNNIIAGNPFSLFSSSMQPSYGYPYQPQFVTGPQYRG